MGFENYPLCSKIINGEKVNNLEIDVKSYQQSLTNILVISGKINKIGGNPFTLEKSLMEENEKFLSEVENLLQEIQKLLLRF